MLMNNVAFVFVDEEILNPFKISTCSIGMMIGSKVERKAIVREIIPLTHDFNDILMSIESHEEQKDVSKPLNRRLSSSEMSVYLNMSIKLFQKLERLILVSKMIPKNLYFLGIIIKCLNDENRPLFSPHKFKEFCNNYLDAQFIDFIMVLINKITFCKLEAKSANFGEIDYKCKKDLHNLYGSVHFCFKSNIELNRVYYISEKIEDEISALKAIDSFNYSLKNVVDNSFYVLEDKEISKNLRNADSLYEKIADKEKVYNVKMLIPMNLMDFENMLDKNRTGNRVLMIKFNSKIVLHFYVNDNLKWGEAVSEIKSIFLKYLTGNIEKLLTDKYMDFANPIIFSLDMDNKNYINYNSIDLVMDADNCNYSIYDIFDIFDQCDLENLSSLNGNKFYKLNFIPI